VIRGGGWFLDARFCRSAFRDYAGPDSRVIFVGFRLARSVTLGP
jgi:formylglycine-generating enzyme required for sulfatase activity